VCLSPRPEFGYHEYRSRLHRFSTEAVRLVEKKNEDVRHRICHCAGSRCRIWAGSAVTVVDNTAVTVEDRHPCCRLNRICPLPLPATAPSPPAVLRITTRSTRSVSCAKPHPARQEIAAHSCAHKACSTVWCGRSFCLTFFRASRHVVGRGAQL